MEFRFNKKEKEMYGDNLMSVGRLVNTCKVLQNILNSQLIYMDKDLELAGISTASNIEILYRNLHGLNIDTSILENLTYSKDGEVKLYKDQEEIKIDYIVGFELSILPFDPKIVQDPEVIQDDKIVLNLRIALPKGSIKYLKDNNINSLIIYNLISDMIYQDLIDQCIPTHQE